MHQILVSGLFTATPNAIDELCPIEPNVKNHTYDFVHLKHEFQIIHILPYWQFIQSGLLRIHSIYVKQSPLYCDIIVFILNVIINLHLLPLNLL